MTSGDYKLPLWLALLGLTVSSSGGAAAAAAKVPAAQLSCDTSITQNFKPDAGTRVLLVKAFTKGEKLPNAPVERLFHPPGDVALADVCMVKLLVGPGNPGPADAPSTSPGVGIEIWLPAKAAWNGRIQAIGGGGWAGNEAGDVNKIADVAASSDIQSPPGLAANGAVVSVTDTGHDNRRAPGGTFAMMPDGSINTALWTDFSWRAIHLQVIMSKALAQAYFGKPARFTYWDGASTGGRQALKQAQRYPQDFDGIIAGSPAINWTRFFTAQLYPYLVIERELAGKYMSVDQLNLVSDAAIAACDVVDGKHLGFILDVARCRYDPVNDAAVLCVGDGGKNGTPACLTQRQALAINKTWYGQTADGSVPDPALDNGQGPLTGKHRWFGISRGTNLANLTASVRAGFWAGMVALEMQDGKIAPVGTQNFKGPGADGWKSLSYQQLSDAFDAGVALQNQFGDINTDDPDLSAFKARGGKLLQLHGTNDELILYNGSARYYESVLARMGGVTEVGKFYRFYEIPGMGHEPKNGLSNPNANPPIMRPAMGEFYRLLTDWVEKGVAPGDVVLRSAHDTPLAKSLPLCAYPTKATFASGNIFTAQSYRCQ